MTIVRTTFQAPNSSSTGSWLRARRSDARCHLPPQEHRTGPTGTALGRHPTSGRPAMSDRITAPPLEARAALVKLLRARAPRAQVEAAADAYRDAIRQLGQRTGRKLPVPSRAFIIRLQS